MTDQDLELVCFTLIVDDIVFPDGRTCMEVLGGGGKLLNAVIDAWQTWQSTMTNTAAGALESYSTVRSIACGSCISCTCALTAGHDPLDVQWHKARLVTARLALLLTGAMSWKSKI